MGRERFCLKGPRTVSAAIARFALIFRIVLHRIGICIYVRL